MRRRGDRPAGEGSPRGDLPYLRLLAAISAAALGVLYAAAPSRTDLLLAVSAGILFAGVAGVAGYRLVARAARRSAPDGMRTFLAVMTAKVLAFPAFLLIIAFSTSLNVAALAAGLAGATLVTEILAIQGLRRVEAGGGPAGGREPRGGGMPGAVNDTHRNED